MTLRSRLIRLAHSLPAKSADRKQVVSLVAGGWTRHPRGPEKKVGKTTAIIMEEQGGYVVYLYPERDRGHSLPVRVLDKNKTHYVSMGSLTESSFAPFATENDAMKRADKFLQAQ